MIAITDRLKKKKKDVNAEYDEWFPEEGDEPKNEINYDTKSNPTIEDLLNYKLGSTFRRRLK